MKERPILFSAPMVRAILEGRKTQTRRVLKKQPVSLGAESPKRYSDGRWRFHHDAPNYYKCPYGKPGDRLWVRERWCVDAKYDHLKPSEIPEWVPIDYWATDIPFHIGKTRQSIFMPRWASEINLEITDIRVERLQEISAKDVEAEGVDVVSALPAIVSKNTDQERMANFIAQDLFCKLWDSINHKAYPWTSNPWVWVVGFKLM